MLKCSNCGKLFDDSAKFCDDCGSALIAVNVTEPQAGATTVLSEPTPTNYNVGATTVLSEPTPTAEAGATTVLTPPTPTADAGATTVLTPEQAPTYDAGATTVLTQEQAPTYDAGATTVLTQEQAPNFDAGATTVLTPDQANAYQQPQQAPVQPTFVAQPQVEKPKKAKKAKKEKTVTDGTEPKAKGGKKALAIALPCVAIVLVAAIIFGIFTFGGAKPYTDAVLYVKDKNLMMTKTSKVEAMKISANFDPDNRYDDDLYIYRDNDLNAYTYFSEDGNTVFYIDNLKKSQGAELYYRSLKDNSQAPVLIASNVDRYSVNVKGDIVTYLTRDDDLYQFDMKSSEKIEKGVSSFRVSNDGKKLYYDTTSGKLFFKKFRKDADELVERGVYNIIATTDDFKTIYYTDNDAALYKMVSGKNSTKIADGMERIQGFCYSTGELYIFSAKDSSTAHKFSEFIVDDMYSKDLTMKEPVDPDNYYYESPEAYQDAKDAYETAKDAYEQKLERDEIRKYLQKTDDTYETYQLSYYDGKEYKILSDSVFYSEILSLEAPAIAVKIYDGNDIPKVKMSSLRDSYEVRSAITQAVSEKAKGSIFSGASVTEVNDTDALDFVFANDGKTVYYLKNYNETKNTADLMKMDYIKNTSEIYDTGVDIDNVYVNSDDTVVYFKELDSAKYTADLYMNKTKIDSGVCYYNLAPVSADKVYYITDFDLTKYEGTLKLYNKGDITKIADGVIQLADTDGGNIAYINSYNSEKETGDLYIYDGKQATKVDSDVNRLLTSYDHFNYHSNLADY